MAAQHALQNANLLYARREIYSANMCNLRTWCFWYSANSWKNCQITSAHVSNKKMPSNLKLLLLFRGEQ